MKTLTLTAFLTLSLATMSFSRKEKPVQDVEIAKAEKLDIKIKNDIGDNVKVTNAGSGGSYNLAENVTTTIKMEGGDKLHYLNKGTKGALILTATKEMDGKVQLLSKL